jgi:hypothetical protein
LEPVEKIVVTFYYAALPGEKKDTDETTGKCEPGGRSTTYYISILLMSDKDEKGEQSWPCDPKVQANCRLRILYTHRAAIARMAAIIGHELLHAWFTYKFSLLTFDSGATGHGGYQGGGTGAFFTVVHASDSKTWPDLRPLKLASDAPFHSRLEAIYREIDEKEPQVR